MKRLGILLCVLALAGAAAACDEVESAGVTVNGEETSQSTVDDYMRDVRDNDALTEIASEQGVELSVSAGTINSNVTAGILSYLVRGEIASQELADRDVEITDEDRQAAREQVTQVFGSEEAFNEFPESFQDDFLDWIAAVIALQAEITDPQEFSAVFTDADVDVNPRYGTWITDPQPAIQSPAAATATTSTSQPT